MIPRTVALAVLLVSACTKPPSPKTCEAPPPARAPGVGMCLASDPPKTDAVDATPDSEASSPDAH